MIREATIEDIPELLVMGKAFCEQLPVKVPSDEASLIASFKHLMEDDNSMLYINETKTGMIGGMVYPYWINTNFLTGNESFWWADGDGLELWTKLEKWAKSKGASFFQMMRLANSEPRLQKIYERRGYFPIEHVYAKVF